MVSLRRARVVDAGAPFALFAGDTPASLAAGAERAFLAEASFIAGVCRRAGY